MINEPLYDEDLVNLGYLNTRLEGTSALLLSQSQNFGTLPTTPYYKYNTYMGTDGIYICINERLIGDYNANDWTKASTYVNVEDAFTQGIVTAGMLQAVNGGTNTAGLTGEGTGNDAIRFWAGSTYAGRGTAPYRVTQGGAVTATNIAITGGSLTWNNINKPTKSDLGTWTTYIDNDGIYTGTLTANQVNAVAINADSITSGTLSTSILNSDVITTSNFSAQNINADNITSGTIRGRTISGGSIAGTNVTFGNQYSGGTLRFYNGVGYLSCGVVSDHPWVSALNIASTGGGTQGISFRTTSSIGNVGSERGHISMNTSNAMFITSSGTVNINNGTGGNVGIKNYVITSGDNIEGPGGAQLKAYNAVTLTAISGSSVYAVGNGLAGSRVLTVAGQSSSRNVKENIKEFTNKEYDEALNILDNMKLYSYKYKYNLYKDKKQYGFIIDELENLPNAKKYFKFDSAIAIIDDEKLDFAKADDKKDVLKDEKTIEVKSYDPDALDKYLLTICKALQQEIEKLKDEIKQIKGGR